MENVVDTTWKSPRIKIYSGILATTYLLFGLFLFHELPKFKSIFSEFNLQWQSFPTKATLSIGPWGWLGFGVASAGFIVLKDLRFRSRFLNLFFTLAFLLWVGCMAWALVYTLLELPISCLH